jgi:hypothetical protein
MPCSNCISSGHNIRTCIKEPVKKEPVKKEPVKTEPVKKEPVKKAHKKASDEKINIDKLHYHINNNTESGKKIQNSFNLLDENIKLTKTIQCGADRKTHYDLKIETETIKHKFDNFRVEFKGSEQFVVIDEKKPPWFYGVQFYNGTGSTFNIGHIYAKKFYDNCLDKIIDKLNITIPKPSYDEWVKDGFRQGKPKTEFVKKIKELNDTDETIKKFLSDLRINFNKTFKLTEIELDIFKNEAEKKIENVLNEKDYWLQIHGDIDNPDKFYVKWNKKYLFTKIIKIEQIAGSGKDINIKMTCNNKIIEAKMRWGYGQCITNIRIDIK